MKCFTIFEGDLTAPEVSSVTPNGMQWATMCMPAEPTQLTNTTTLFPVVLYKRQIPTAAIKLHVANCIAEANLQGKPTRAMVATWKEEYLTEHLPNAPIVPVQVPVIYDSFLNVCLVGATTDAVIKAALEFMEIEGKLAKTHDVSTIVRHPEPFKLGDSWRVAGDCNLSATNDEGCDIGHEYLMSTSNEIKSVKLEDATCEFKYNWKGQVSGLKLAYDKDTMPDVLNAALATCVREIVKLVMDSEEI